MVNIRLVQPTDNEALARVIRGVFIEHDAPTQGTVFSDPTTDALFELFDTHKAELWVADEDGKLLGCCGIYPTEGLPEHYAELVKFYLAQEARGKGIGKELMQHCFSRAAALGYKTIYLETMPEFAKAVSMYEMLGFQTINAPLGNSGHPACTIWMVKDLA